MTNGFSYCVKSGHVYLSLSLSLSLFLTIHSPNMTFPRLFSFVSFKDTVSTAYATYL
jgi:hypothetical protein